MFIWLLLTLLPLCYSQFCATNMAQCSVSLYNWETCNCATVSENNCLLCLKVAGVYENSITYWISANTNGKLYIHIFIIYLYLLQNMLFVMLLLLFAVFRASIYCKVEIVFPLLLF